LTTCALSFQELEFEKEALSMLLWQLEADDMADRLAFFNDVRGAHTATNHN